MASWVFGRTEPCTKFYVLGELIGQPGQFGKAVRAEHIQTGEKWACKIISKARFAKNPQGLEQFKNEVLIMAKLKHPNIITFKEFFEDEVNVYIIMELCTGGEMFDQITARGRYTEKDASSQLRQIFEALDVLHQNRIAHCDLKPDNFLLANKNPDSPVKLIDFGLAKFRRKKEHFTRFCGTPYYVAPEVLRQNYTESADVWSMGVVMYVMLFGFPPFYANPSKGNQNQTDTEIYRQILKGFTPVTKAGYGPWFPSNISVSNGAKDLISKMLTMDPAKRPTVQEALNHPWMKGENVSEEPLDALVLEGLRTFDKSTKFKERVLDLLVSQLEEEEVALLKEEFHKMDQDASGTVTVDELKAILKSAASKGLGSHGQGSASADSEEIPTRSRGESVLAKEIIKSVDVDGDGLISLNELMLSFVHRKLYAKEERMFALFRSLDKDGNGFLTKDELAEVLVSQKVTNFLNDTSSSSSEEKKVKDDKGTDVDEILLEIDKNGDGKIDYEEFFDLFWEKGAPKAPSIFDPPQKNDHDEEKQVENNVSNNVQNDKAEVKEEKKVADDAKSKVLEQESQQSNNSNSNSKLCCLIM